MIPLDKLVNQAINKTCFEKRNQFDKYFCQYCDDLDIHNHNGTLFKHLQAVLSTRFGETMSKYYEKDIRSAIELMIPNLIGEDEFAVLFKDDHMVIHIN
jgi:hypothetical protein